MEENSVSGGGPGQGHNGQPFAGVNVSVANNKHQLPGSGLGGQGQGQMGPGMEFDGGGGGQGPGGGQGMQGQGKEQSPQYTMPGVLHFLQHEWARFELERSQWELDRAEFQVC